MTIAGRTEGLRFQDFELTVTTRARNAYRVSGRSASGEASGHMTLDPSAKPWRVLLDAIEVGVTDEQFFFDLGTRLFSSLFPGDVEDAYRSSLGYAKGQEQGLRIRLRLTQSSEIAALPWEYIYDRKRDIFVALSSDTPLSRFIEPQQVFPPPPPPQGRLRVLTILSAPSNLARYGLTHPNVEAELDSMDFAFKGLKARDLLEEIEPLRHAVRADISEALSEHRPHVVHFFGHGVFAGGHGALILENEEHLVTRMSDRVFRELLEGYPTVRLVVLNACRGAARSSGDALVGMGPQLVSRGVPAVVAMQYPVDEQAAKSFTREFYGSLARWNPIDVAVSQARRAIYLDIGLDRRDWGVPVLFMRDPDGLLFQPPFEDAASNARAHSVDAERGTGTAYPEDPDALRLTLDAYVKNGQAYSKGRRAQLRQILVSHFDVDELQTLCFDLGIEYEILKPGGRTTTVRELILYCERYRRLHELVQAAYLRHPEGAW